MGRWVYRLASKAEGLILDEKADTAIVNLTAVNVAGGQVWLWIATELGHRAVLAVMLVEARNALIAYSLFTCLRRHGVRHVIADSASWYRLAAGWTGPRHSVVRGGLRSHVKRFIEAVKDKLTHKLLFFIPKKPLDSALRLVYA